MGTDAAASCVGSAGQQGLKVAWHGVLLLCRHNICCRVLETGPVSVLRQAVTVCGVHNLLRTAQLQGRVIAAVHRASQNVCMCALIGTDVAASCVGSAGQQDSKVARHGALLPLLCRHSGCCRVLEDCTASGTCWPPSGLCAGQLPRGTGH
jgi:hypothetical protein